MIRTAGQTRGTTPAAAPARLPAPAIALAIALATAGALPGAAAAQDRHITYREAVRIALQQNSDLQRAENAAVLDGTSVADARMAFLPDLRLGFSGDRSYGRYFSENEGRLLNQTNESFGARVSSSVVLFDGLSNLAELRRAGLQRRAGDLGIERTRQTVIFTVISGYLALIEAEEQVRIREENHAAQVEQEQLVRGLVDGGERPVSDLYQQQANVAAARLSLVEARRDDELRRVDLVQALQLDPAGGYVFEIPELPDSSAAGEEPELGDLVERAFRRRPDVQAAEAELAASRQAEAAAAGGAWPTLSASASYGSNYASTGNSAFWDQLDERRTGSVGLSLSVPLFDRLSTRHARQRARVATENARLALDDLHQEVALQVRRAVLDWTAARERLRAAEAQLLAARQALDATRERYEAGVATLYEVTQSRADLVAATSTRVSASYNLLWQKRLLDYYVGELDPEGGLL